MLQKLPATLKIIFYEDHPSPSEMETFIANILIATAVIQPNHDILASAWYSPTRNEDDEKKINTGKDGDLLYKVNSKTFEEIGY